MNESKLEYFHNRITLGIQAREALTSKVAEYLLVKVRKEVEDALDEFIEADPSDQTAMAAIQVKVKTALAFPQWLNAAIIDGDQAVSEYREEKELEDERIKGGI